jgi:hypothetical protein
MAIAGEQEKKARTTCLSPPALERVTVPRRPVRSSTPFPKAFPASTERNNPVIPFDPAAFNPLYSNKCNLSVRRSQSVRRLGSPVLSQPWLAPPALLLPRIGSLRAYLSNEALPSSICTCIPTSSPLPPSPLCQLVASVSRRAGRRARASRDVS